MVQPRARRAHPQPPNLCFSFFSTAPTMDPLDSTSAWGGSSASAAASPLPSATSVTDSTPGPWSSAASTSSASAASAASTVPDLREPRVYGDPVPALPAPPAGEQRQQNAPFLRVRIAGVDRNRKDLLVRFDSSVSAPRRAPSAERRRREAQACRGTLTAPSASTAINQH